MNHPRPDNARRRVTRPLRVKSPARTSKQTWMLGPCLVAVGVLIGCASNEVTPSGLKMTQMPSRPNHILVYDFAASVEDVSTDAPLAARLSTRSSLPPDQLAMARQLGAEMSVQLVKAIREMGLPAERALPGATLQVHDVVIRGYLVSIHGTNAVRRFTVGLDPGAAEFTAAAENFQAMPQGFGRPLGSSAQTPGEKALGAAIGEDANPMGHILSGGMKNEGEADRRARIQAWSKEAVSEIAERLKARFQQQGWTN